MNFVDLKIKLTTLLLASLIMTCSVVKADNADFSYFSLAQSPMKPANKIQLNTQDDSQIPKTPREYVTPTTVIENPKPMEVTQKEMLPLNSDFFAPEEDNVAKVAADEEASMIPQALPTEINTSVADDITYYNSVDPDDAEPNLEGRTIKSVEISGLETIKPDFVLEQISTRIGSKFNTVILQKDLQNIYATGYFTDIMSIEPSVRYDGDIDLVFNIQENIIVNDATFIHNTVVTAAELEQFIAPLKGKPQNLDNINEAIEGITNYYHEKGYILASVKSVDDDVKGILCFNINEGVIDNISISGNERTQDFVIARNIMTQPGSVYNEECLKKDLSKVFATQIFDEVNRDIIPSDDKEGYYNVIVTVKEKSTDSVSIGAGIDSAIGLFGSASIREDNFLGRNQKISLTGVVGTGVLLNDASIKERVNYSVELNFFEPYLLNPETSLASKLYFRELGSYNIPLAIERRIGANAIVEHQVKNKDHLKTNFMLGLEHIHLKEGDAPKIAGMFTESGMDISKRAKQLEGGFFANVAPGITYSTLDDEEMPREGIIAQGRYTEAFGLNHFERTNGRLTGGVTRFTPVYKKSTVALTARAGLKVHGDDMPEIMAYRLGGPYSIRGFRMNGVGSGEMFMLGSAELLTPVPFLDKLKYDICKKTRFAFFMDAGRVFEETTSSKLYDRPLSAISTGIGLRIFIPGIGPVAVDYGIPLTNVGHYGKHGGYFTFGTNGMSGYGY